jgi:hypothetical protein
MLAGGQPSQPGSKLDKHATTLTQHKNRGLNTRIALTARRRPNLEKATTPRTVRDDGHLAYFSRFARSAGGVEACADACTEERTGTHTRTRARTHTHELAPESGGLLEKSYMAELRISSPPLSLNGSRRRHVCTNRTVVKPRPRRPLWKTPLHSAATDGMSLTPAPPLRRRPSSPIPALWAR